MGPIKPSLAICVFSVFVLVYFSLWKGVRSAGKVVWVTALAPYVVLFFLLIRGVTLPGAGEGIRYYLTPQWHKLKNSRVCALHIDHIDIRTASDRMMHLDFSHSTNRFGSMRPRKYSFRSDPDLVRYWHCPVTTNSTTIATATPCSPVVSTV